MALANIHSFETFGSADGPGVRCVIFLSGCNLRCAYCHNPDTWAKPPSSTLSAEELLAKAMRYKSYWGSTGGITVSGGEPLLQLDFLLEFFSLAKKKNINTCLDTSAEPFSTSPSWLEKFNRLAPLIDTVLLDIKHIDSAAHRSLTGKGNENILACAQHLATLNVNTWIRYVLVPGINDSPSILRRTAQFVKTLPNVSRLDVLPYHTLGLFKWRELGIPYRLEGVPTPSPESIALAKEILAL